MPKKSVDHGRKNSTAMAASRPQNNKTERSHEENQERAYIAASRRADRSLEARVQSARMASEIHKKRTGKGFRISEDIVMKEEMYEEEEDEFPRSYRLLGPHMQTASPEMNSRVEAYLTNKVAMSRLVASTNDEWRQNEINKLFAQSFPNAGRQAQELNQRMADPNFASESYQSHAPTAQTPMSPSFQSVNFQQGNEDVMDRFQTASSAEQRQAEIPVSPALLDSHTDSQTPLMAATTDFNNAMAMSSAMENENGQGSGNGGDESAFTSDLPTEAKLLMGGPEANDPYGNNMFNQDWLNTDQFGDTLDVGHDFKADSFDHMSQQPPYYGNDALYKWEPTDTTAAMDEPVWDSFLNDSAWAGDQ